MMATTRSTPRTYPCIGGPLAGERMATSFGEGASTRPPEAGEYTLYNRGAHTPTVRVPGSRRRTKRYETAVFVHVSITDRVAGMMPKMPDTTATQPGAFTGGDHEAWDA